MFGLGFNRSSPPGAPAKGTHASPACFHCGLALPAPVPAWLEFAGAPRPMCCASCLAAARTIVDAGYGAYYAGRLGAGSAATATAEGDA